MPVPLVWVDAFSEVPFAGNPAAVCLLEEPRPSDWMQAVARELGLSETAFVLAEGDGFRLRWFTPATEVDLCGHATLASAHALWSEDRLGADARARFHTRSGLLEASYAPPWITLDFPADPPAPCEPPAELVAGLNGAPLLEAGRARQFFLAVLADPQAVRGLTPDLTAIGALPGYGLIVTAQEASDEHDFVSRMFSPQLQVDEDPVTGAAHCVLGPYWGARLERAALVGYQASARGGRVRVTLAGERVQLGGQATTVLRGELL